MSGGLIHCANVLRNSFDKLFARIKGTFTPDEFQRFQSLPPELRRMIWGFALDLEKRHRDIYFNYRSVAPSRDFVSPLLLVNAESRAEALRRYPDAHPVYRFFQYCDTPVPAGVLHVNQSKGFLYLHGHFPTSLFSLDYREPANRVDDIWVPALDAWLYQHPHRCYYIANRSSSMCLLAEMLYNLRIRSSKPSDPPPKQSELRDFYQWLHMFLLGTMIFNFPNSELYFWALSSSSSINRD
ncbi:hypothetical protein PG984_015251 [Apiospora sp. TS-2023a]